MLRIVFGLVFVSACWFPLAPGVQGQCYKQVPTCSIDTRCRFAPTTLPLVGSELECAGDGWLRGTTRCGVKTCMLVLSCPCGNYLTDNNTLCSGAGQPGCETIGSDPICPDTDGDDPTFPE